MKVAAFTSGLHVPSSRFRVRQNIPFLNKREIYVKEYISSIDKYQGYPTNEIKKFSKLTFSDEKINTYRYKHISRSIDFLRSKFSDLIWLERMLIPGVITYELKFKKPFVFDLDDAIWLPGHEGEGILDKVIQSACMVFAGNNFLADWCSVYNSNVKVLPTAVDVNKFFPDYSVNTNKIKIGWIGTSSNFEFLSMVYKPIINVLNKYSNVEFHVCSNTRPDFSHKSFFFQNWSPEVETSFIQNLNIGIMPLPDNDWTKGKCSFKMLQYMACGKPVVVSPVGMNATLLKELHISDAPTSLDDWTDQLICLIDNFKLREDLGKRGRKLVEDKYSCEAVSDKIAESFKEII